MCINKDCRGNTIKWHMWMVLDVGTVDIVFCFSITPKFLAKRLYLQLAHTREVVGYSGKCTGVWSLTSQVKMPVLYLLTM